VCVVTADLDYLPPELRSRQVMSWCPFCHLGWKRDPQSKLCCSIGLPTGTAVMHVPAITWDRETPAAKIKFMFHPRPWEISALARAGIDPRTARREVPGLRLALEKGAKINALVKRGHSRSAATTAVESQYELIDPTKVEETVVS
jgi:hypothetical protein